MLSAPFILFCLSVGGARAISADVYSNGSSSTLGISLTAGATAASRTLNEALTTFPASLSGCQSCSWSMVIAGGPWIPDVATHTVATILLIIDNSTNITSTSTLPGSSFSSESHEFADLVVTGTVATHDVGGMKIFLTYPTAYVVYSAFSKGTAYPERVNSLDKLGSNGPFTCHQEDIYYTDVFAIPVVSGVDYSQLSEGASYLSFLSSLRSNCTAGAVGSIANTKLAVSLLTATATSFVSLNGAKSVRPSPAPKPGTTNLPPTTTQALAPKGSATPEDDKPTSKITVETTSVPEPQPLPQPFPQFPPQPAPQPPPSPPSQLPSQLPSQPPPRSSSNCLPQSAPNPAAIPPSQPIVSAQSQQTSNPLTEPASISVPELDDNSVPRPVIILGDNPITANPFSEFVTGGQTLKPGGPEITVAGTPISLAPSASYVVIGGITSALVSKNPLILPLLTLGGSVITANSATQFVVGSQTLAPGYPAITISGTPLSLAPSASNIVIGGTTIPLTVAVTPSGPAVVIAGETFPNSASEYNIGSQTLIPGAPAIKISGTPISLAPLASNIVVGGTTVPLTAATTPGAPPLTLAGTTVFPNSASAYIIGSQTLIPGAPAITVSGTVLSLAPSPFALVIGSKTIHLTSPTAAPILTIAGHTITPDAASRYVIDGQTLVPGGPAITISGTRISLAPKATDIVVASSTLGLGGLIISGFGGLPTRQASSTGPEAYRGEAAGIRRVGVGAGALSVGIGLGVWMGL